MSDYRWDRIFDASGDSLPGWGLYDVVGDVLAMVLQSEEAAKRWLAAADVPRFGWCALTLLDRDSAMSWCERQFGVTVTRPDGEEAPARPVRVAPTTDPPERMSDEEFESYRPLFEMDLRATEQHWQNWQYNRRRAAFFAECERARAAEAELADRLLTEQLQHDECHLEYDSLVACAEDTATQLTEALASVKALEARCAQLESKLDIANINLQAARAERGLLRAERQSAVRIISEWQARCEAREAALRECLSLAETGDCGAIAIAVEAALGEVTP